MDDISGVAWHLECWHIRMDEDACDLVDQHTIHEGPVMDVLERVQTPMLGLRGFGLRNRMLRAANAD